MRTVEEHRDAVLALVRPLPQVSVRLSDALDAALAVDVVADAGLPRFDNSAMDGYAVHVDDITATPSVLAVSADVPAGAWPGPLTAGTAARIMTGAALPPGADAVIPVELTDGGTSDVRLDQSVSRGANIRRAGEDVQPGTRVLAAGTALTPARLGLLASLGVGTVTVRRQPRVGVLSTGSELVAVGDVLAEGAIYDSNGPLLTAAVAAAGADPVLAGPVPDDEEIAAEALRTLAGEVDLLVTSGGISAGAFEVVKDIFRGDGDVTFVKVAMQPGMPQGCGTFAGTPLLTVPGNPVSAFVSFEVFVRPVIRRLAGHAVLDRPVRRGVLATGVDRRPTKQQYRRARWLPDGTVHLVGGTGSHLLHALAHADALLVVPPGDGALAAGATVDVIDLGG